MCRQDNPQDPTAAAEIDDTTANIRATSDEPIAICNDHAIGTILLLPKPYQRTRFALQNPHGMSVRTTGDLEMTMQTMKEMEIDVMMFPETNLDTNKRCVRSQVYNYCRRVFGLGNYQVAMAASPQENATNHKPGGVLGITIGKTVGHVIERGSDEMG